MNFRVMANIEDIQEYIHNGLTKSMEILNLIYKFNNNFKRILGIHATTYNNRFFSVILLLCHCIFTYKYFLLPFLKSNVCFLPFFCGKRQFFLIFCETDAFALNENISHELNLITPKNLLNKFLIHK